MERPLSRRGILLVRAFNLTQTQTFRMMRRRTMVVRGSNHVIQVCENHRVRIVSSAHPE